MNAPISSRPTVLAMLAALLISGTGAAPAYAAPDVVSSIRPVHALVRAVMGDAGTPQLLLKGNTTPHHMTLKPSQRRLLAAADVIFRIGGDLEAWLDKPLKQRRREGSVVVSLIDSEGLELLDVREGGIWQTGHGHDDHDHGNDHHDPHIWLDPKNAIAMTRQIAATLTKADPANAAAYRSNAARLAGELDELTAAIERRLAPVKATPFIVFHDGYQYFEKRFGLNSVGAIAIDPERRPGAKRLHEIRRLIEERGATCVFAEPQFEVSYVATVTESTPARTARLDPVGPAETSYPALITAMADAVANCLSGKE